MTDSEGRQEQAAAAQQLGSALQSLQRQSGITLRDLAPRVRSTTSSLSRYFRGETVPLWSIVHDVCQVLGADPVEYRSLWEAATRNRNPSPADDGVTQVPNPPPHLTQLGRGALASPATGPGSRSQR
jgi:transcriptional regulator with XRE-family HTH domain